MNRKQRRLGAKDRSFGKSQGHSKVMSIHKRIGRNTFKKGDDIHMFSSRYTEDVLGHRTFQHTEYLAKEEEKEGVSLSHGKESAEEQNEVQRAEEDPVSSKEEPRSKSV